MLMCQALSDDELVALMGNDGGLELGFEWSSPAQCLRTPLVQSTLMWLIGFLRLFIRSSYVFLKIKFEPKEYVEKVSTFESLNKVFKCQKRTGYQLMFMYIYKYILNK